ncbi:hypothetical protein PVK06_003142 [Gossypium arboreum]|uniref:Uncharacterized protein n=1 Tax=Gossypium arboreum TaxID=29729 RepID=A0ABR0R6N8_GOSAR|nr:hypothetical protein PVK06_003142 [Gossypium arboreum]
MKMMNQSLLASQAWRIFKESSWPEQNTIVKKYCKRSHFEPADYWIWKSLLFARAVWLGSNIGLKEISFSKMVVHKGKSIIRDNVAWSSKDVLEMVSILWSIWFHQNGCCFKSYKPNPMQVLSKAKNCLFAFEPNVEQKDLSFTSRIRSFKLD